MRALTASLDVPAMLGQNVTLDTGVLIFTGVLAVLTGVLFGLAPALQTTRTDVQDTLREGGRSGMADRTGQFLRRAFVVAEFGLALSLLAGAGLLIKSFSRLQAVDPGFDPDNLLTAQVVLPTAKYTSDTMRIAFFDRALDRIAALPGVVDVGATQVLPFGGAWSTGSFNVEGFTPAEGEPSPWGDQRIVTADYHSTMKIPLVRGRYFTEQDGQNAPRVVIVDEELARRYYPDTDPIGKRLIFGPQDNPNSYAEIVGVVGHTAHEGLDADARIQVYHPQRQRGLGFMNIAVRTQGDPLRFVDAVRSAVREVDPDQPLARIATMDDLLSRSTGQRRMSMLLLGIFAAIGLTLAATGIYGVMSYSVSQRAQEMGVRMALGASRTEVLAIVMRQGMILAGIGTAIGLLAAAALTRAVQSQLFGVAAWDPATFVGVTVLLVLIGALATFVPAWRATRLDPVFALRQE
jgi:putative ABC transport system permease protein